MAKKRKAKKVGGRKKARRKSAKRRKGANIKSRLDALEVAVGIQSAVEPESEK